MKQNYELVKAENDRNEVAQASLKNENIAKSEFADCIIELVRIGSDKNKLRPYFTS